MLIKLLLLPLLSPDQTNRHDSNVECRYSFGSILADEPEATA